MAGVQPATRRLLTEATGVLATQRGAANGVATLGADGKVTSTQLPAAALPRTAYLTADVSTSSTTPVDTLLKLTALPAGTYLFDVDFTGGSTPGLGVITLTATGLAATWRWMGQAGGTPGYGASSTSPSILTIQATAWSGRMAGQLILAAAGAATAAVAVQLNTGSSSTATLRAGSGLRLTQVA